VNDATALAYVISKNLCRRDLTAEQRREVLAKVVAAQPGKSDRELAKQAGVSHPTIAKARRKAEATGKALPVEKRVGADGKARKQPAKKAKPAKAATKLTQKNQREEWDRRFDEEADKVVAILIERLGRSGLVLVAAALNACGSGGLDQAVNRQIRGTPDEQLVEDCYDQEEFIASFGKPKPADDGLDIPECLRRAPTKAAV
jgi:transposase